MTNLLTTLPTPSPAPLTIVASGSRPFIPVLAGEESAALNALSFADGTEANLSAFEGGMAHLTQLCGGNDDRAFALLDQYDADPESDWL